MPKQKLIAPTVGRQVWYYGDHEDELDGHQPHAATVVYVHDYRTVNLVAFTADGDHYPVRNCRLLQEDDVARKRESYARWMPYQLKQAEES